MSTIHILEANCPSFLEEAICRDEVLRNLKQIFTDVTEKILNIKLLDNVVKSMIRGYCWGGNQMDRVLAICT